MLTTTLNEIRKHSLYTEGWGKLLKHLGKTKADDDLVSFEAILESNGVDDMLWCLRVLPEDMDNKVRLLSCSIAETALKYVPGGEDRPKQAIEVARKFANGEATQEELQAAWVAAKYAAWIGNWGANWGPYWGGNSDSAVVSIWDGAEAAARAAAWAAAVDDAKFSDWGADEATNKAAAIAPAWAAARCAAKAAAGDDAVAAAREQQKTIILDWLKQFDSAERRTNA